MRSGRVESAQDADSANRIIYLSVDCRFKSSTALFSEILAHCWFPSSAWLEMFHTISTDDLGPTFG